MTLDEAVELSGLNSLDGLNLDEDMGREIEYVDAVEITDEYARVLILKSLLERMDSSLIINKPSGSCFSFR